MSSIRADGIEFDAQAYLEDPVVFQPALIDARQKYGFALCMCSAPPRQLVIREVKGVAYLAVWPNDGPNHDTGCEFHREIGAAEPSDDEKADLAAEHQGGERPARLVRPAAKVLPDGHWDIAIDLPRPPSGRSGDSHRPAKDARDGSATEPVRRDQFSVGEMLGWMWENANFNRWGKGWRRDWRRVGDIIRRDAQTIQIAGESLADCLYVPLPYRSDDEAAMQAQWDHFVQPLVASAEHGPNRKRGFVLAEVKAFDRTEYGFRVQLRNMARPLFVDDHLHAALAKSSPLALALLPKVKAMGCSVVALWAIEATGRGNFRAIAGALLLVNSRYIPVSTTAELQIANALCGSDRTFTKGVGRYNGADFVIREGGQPKALLVYTLNSPDYLVKRDAVAQRCVDAGCSVWKWHITQSKVMPNLPFAA